MSDVTTTTPQPLVVSANVLESYNARERGERPKDIAERLSITPSTVSANHKRVREAIASGRPVQADNGDATTSTTSAPVVDAVDPHAIADGMVDGASLITKQLERITSEADGMRERADAIMRRAHEQRDALVTGADTLMNSERPKLERVATALGFDIDAWTTAVDAERAKLNATAEPAPEPTTEPAPEPTTEPSTDAPTS